MYPFCYPRYTPLNYLWCTLFVIRGIPFWYPRCTIVFIRGVPVCYLSFTLFYLLCTFLVFRGVPVLLSVVYPFDVCDVPFCVIRDVPFYDPPCTLLYYLRRTPLKFAVYHFSYPRFTLSVICGLPFLLSAIYPFLFSAVYPFCYQQCTLFVIRGVHFSVIRGLPF